jgi:ABC-type tungstate transport system permease subunit
MLQNPVLPARRLVTPLLGLLVAAVWLVAPAPARADTSSSLTVIGTSDVSDSGLMANLIQPAFVKAYPQFQFKYIGTASGTAISQAESGAAGASVLLVHAESLENQFVARGYSYEKYGRAVFSNDFVLAGPGADPAGVAANGAHDVARAFADVAAAGLAGRATFVSRGGTPGTTVEEHALWHVVDSAHLAPAGVLLCSVNATQGGGETPISPGNGVTANGQSCPSGGALPTASQLPSWYVATGLSQGPNVQAGNACNGYPSGPNSCYVLTDRGTYDYLASGTDPAGSIPSLKILSRDNSPSAPGGANLLINYFHAYAINPSKLGGAVNLTAAKDFLNFLTSPAIQSQIGAYLAHTSDAGGAPFKADASPIIMITGKSFPAEYHAGRPVTISGSVANAEPGYPAPSGQPVSVAEVSGLAAIPVATVKTSSTGAFTIRFVPPSTGLYAVGTPQITQIEDTALTPAFGDILSPASTTSTKMTVHSAITTFRARSIGGSALAIGTVSPGAGHVKGLVTVLARKGTKGRFKQVAVDRLGVDDANFAVAPRLAAGRWQLKLRFQDGKQLIGSTSRTVKITVGPPPKTRLRISSVTVTTGSTTVSGAVSPAATSRGAVELIGLRTSGTAARFVRVGTARVRRGRFTVHVRLRSGFRWVLQVEDVLTPRLISYSTPLRTINVR